jgi:hypothetical protein
MQPPWTKRIFILKEDNNKKIEKDIKMENEKEKKNAKVRGNNSGEGILWERQLYIVESTCY